MRVNADCEVKVRVAEAEFAAELQRQAIVVSSLKGEVVGYQRVIEAFAEKGGRKSLGTFEVTAYDMDGCKPFDDGVTSIGLPVGDGIFAVNPKEIPYGSLLRIPEINKYGIAGDTGAAMRRNPRSIDIFMAKADDAKQFGRRKMEVELVKLEGN